MQSALALGVFRIVVALLFLLHGTAKLFGWPDGAPAEVGLWPVWWAGLLEVVPGSVIAMGLFTRPAAFVASGMMAVAYFCGETAVLYCFAFALLVFTGPGALAISRRHPFDAHGPRSTDRGPSDFRASS